MHTTNKMLNLICTATVLAAIGGAATAETMSSARLSTKQHPVR